jgi:dihydrofolate reductase
MALALAVVAADAKRPVSTVARAAQGARTHGTFDSGKCRLAQSGWWSIPRSVGQAASAWERAAEGGYGEWQQRWNRHGRRTLGEETLMGKLIYTVIASLDGYVADKQGNFDWAAPDEEVHAFVNDLERSVGTYLYGRRMYETMVYWETANVADLSPVTRDFAGIWQSAEKVVYSTLLSDVSSSKTRLERRFDLDMVREMKKSSDRDLSVGGPHLAAQAIKAGLVDEFRLFLTPILVGGGNAALPDDVRLRLELLNERRFSNGVVYLRYRA